MKAKATWERIREKWASFSHLTAYDVRIGPFSVRLRFASPLLAQKLTPALDHLLVQTSESSHDLTIDIWDASAPGGALPMLDWDLIEGNGYRGFWEPPFYFHHFEAIQGLSALNLEENRAFYIVRDASSLPWWVSGSPLQAIFHAWFQEQGIQLTHAAAIGNGGEALLLAGKGGSGKSTLTLSCLTDGLDYIAEDYALVQPGTPPRVLSIYQSAKWALNTRKLFPGYDRFIANPESAEREKALLFLQELFPNQMRKEACLKGIVSLEIGREAAPHIRKADLQETMRHLIMSTLFQLPFHHEKTAPILKQVAWSLPCHHLTLGRDLGANLRAIRELI